MNIKNTGQNKINFSLTMARRKSARMCYCHSKENYTNILFLLKKQILPSSKITEVNPSIVKSEYNTKY